MPLSQAVLLRLPTPNSGPFQGLVPQVSSSLLFLSFPVLLQPLFPTPFSSDQYLCSSDVSSAFLWDSLLPLLTSCMTLSPFPKPSFFWLPHTHLGLCWPCSFYPVPSLLWRAAQRLLLLCINPGLWEPWCSHSTKVLWNIKCFIYFYFAFLLPWWFAGVLYWFVQATGQRRMYTFWFFEEQGSATCKGYWSMHQVTQSVLQAVEFTGGFLAKPRITLANSAQHVTQWKVCF